MPPLCCLWAQADPAMGWLSVLVQMGSFGLVAYLIVVGLPALNKEIKTDRQTERNDFATALKGVIEERKAERADFTGALQKVIDFTAAQIEGIRTAADKEKQADRAFYAAEAESMRKMYFESAAAMRTAVHDVRDVAQRTVNKAQVAIDVAKEMGEPS